MTSIDHVTLERADPTTSTAFYAAAFGFGTRVRVRASDAPTTGFRGFTLSLIVSQPSTVGALIDSAVEAGATALKPAEKSIWGWGGAVEAPDGTIWKVATSAKKETGPATRQVDQIVLLLAAEDVAASKRFYDDHGLTVGKNFGKYVASDRHRQRRRIVHRPGRVRLGGSIRLMPRRAVASRPPPTLRERIDRCREGRRERPEQQTKTG